MTLLPSIFQYIDKVSGSASTGILPTKNGG